jgi:hypothetical protein
MTANLTTPKYDHMTAGGQIIERLNYRLPPVAFRINIPVMATRVSGSNPSRTGARRLFPPARLPVICVSFIAMISAHPDVIPAWTNGTMLPDADRWSKLDYYLRTGRYYPKGKSKQRSKNQISHSLLLGLYEQVCARSRRSVSLSFGLLKVISNLTADYGKLHNESRRRLRGSGEGLSPRLSRGIHERHSSRAIRSECNGGTRKLRRAPTYSCVAWHDSSVDAPLRTATATKAILRVSPTTLWLFAGRTTHC